MDMIRLDQLPKPLGARKGHYDYVKGHPAPVWIENGFDWEQFLKRAGLVVGLLTAIVAVVAAVAKLL